MVETTVDVNCRWNLEILIADFIEKNSLYSPCFRLVKSSKSLSQMKLEMLKGIKSVLLTIELWHVEKVLEKLGLTVECSKVINKSKIVSIQSFKLLAGYSCNKVDRHFTFNTSDHIEREIITSFICEIKNFNVTTNVSNIEKRLALLNFDSYLNNENLSDVTLCLGEKKIPAHKVILSAKSTYFATMFSSETMFTENLTNELKIEFEYENFYQVLKYLYTGKLDDRELSIIETFKLANYYQIDCLTTACEELLRENVENFENLFEVLKLSDDYEQAELKKSCISLFVKNVKSFENHDELQGLVKTNPNLLLELLEGLISHTK